MRLSLNYTLEDFCRSSTATRLGVKNIPDIESLANLGRLVEELEDINRLYYEPRGATLKPNSVFRNPMLNAAVGGSKGSYHMFGCAADFDPPPGMTHDELQKALAAEPNLSFDLLMEEGTKKLESEGGSRWLHYQIAKPGRTPRRLVRDAEVDRLGGTITRTERG